MELILDIRINTDYLFKFFLCLTFTFNRVGNVAGDVAGNVAGNVAGTVAGTVAGFVAGFVAPRFACNSPEFAVSWLCWEIVAGKWEKYLCFLQWHLHNMVEARELDTCGLTRYDLAWNTTSCSVSKHHLKVRLVFLFQAKIKMLRTHIHSETPIQLGFKPKFSRLQAQCSTIELSHYSY